MRLVKITIFVWFRHYHSHSDLPHAPLRLFQDVKGVASDYQLSFALIMRWSGHSAWYKTTVTKATIC